MLAAAGADILHLAKADAMGQEEKDVWQWLSKTLEK